MTNADMGMTLVRLTEAVCAACAASREAHEQTLRCLKGALEEQSGALDTVLCQLRAQGCEQQDQRILLDRIASQVGAALPVRLKPRQRRLTLPITNRMSLDGSAITGTRCSRIGILTPPKQPGLELSLAHGIGAPGDQPSSPLSSSRCSLDLSRGGAEVLPSCFPSEEGGTPLAGGEGDCKVKVVPPSPVRMDSGKQGGPQKAAEGDNSPPPWKWPSMNSESAPRRRLQFLLPGSYRSTGSEDADVKGGSRGNADRLDVPHPQSAQLLTPGVRKKALSDPSPLPISTEARGKLQRRQRVLERLVRSPTFDGCCAVAIVGNLLSMGLQANQCALAPTEPCQGKWVDVNLAFNVAFLFELLLRLSGLRRRFFCGSDWLWNLWDLIIVLSATAEEIVRRASTGGSDNEKAAIGRGVAGLRIVRVLRLIRITRAVRLMHLFRELRVMIQSILRCLVPFCWACSLLLVIQWCFSTYFVHLAADYVSDGLLRVGPVFLEENSVMQLRERYGSLWVALYTLFQSVTGGIDWGEGAEPLMVVGLHPIFLYIAYVALTIFAVLNVVTSVFVQNATKLALQDHDLVIQEQLNDRQAYIRAALGIFAEADSDGNGWITREQFEQHLADPRVRAFFSCLELTGLEARRLFDMLDPDCSGVVDAEQFVTGCMSLRGAAKTMDVAALEFEHRRLAESVHARLDELLGARGGASGETPALDLSRTPFSRGGPTASQFFSPPAHIEPTKQQ